MQTFKSAFLAATAVLALAGCSGTYGAAPMGAGGQYDNGQYIGSSQQYQDYSQHMQQSPDVAASHAHGQ